MALSPTTSIKLPVASNSNVATYVVSCGANNATTGNVANGSTWRISLAGWQSPVSANGETYNPATQFNIHVGTAGTVGDNVIYSLVENAPAGQQFFRQILVTARLKTGNWQFIAASSAGNANSAVAPFSGLASANIANSASNVLGVSHQPVSGTNEAFANVEIALIEHVI